MSEQWAELLSILGLALVYGVLLLIADLRRATHAEREHLTVKAEKDKLTKLLERVVEVAASNYTDQVIQAHHLERRGESASDSAALLDALSQTRNQSPSIQPQQPEPENTFGQPPMV